MPTREDLESALPVGSEVLSGGGRSRFWISEYRDHGVRIASTSSRKKALLRFAKLDLVLANFHRIDPFRIQDSIMELMKQHDRRWTENETFLYGFAREYRSRTGAMDLVELHADFERQVSECAQMSDHDRRSLLETDSKKPRKVVVQTTVFMRNPAVVAEVVLRANGNCEACGNTSLKTSSMR